MLKVNVIDHPQSQNSETLKPPKQEEYLSKVLALLPHLALLPGFSLITHLVLWTCYPNRIVSNVKDS
jgi:hypothetical protein